MIKEVVQFIEGLADFKGIGVKPKEGLHVLLRLHFDGERHYMDDTSLVNSAFTRKKGLTAEEAEFLKRCAALTQVAWSVNTNKCFDLPAKGIHSCSPYCVAFKRESLEGGDKHGKDKTKLYERFSGYFANALALLDDEREKERLKVFAGFLSSKDKVDALLKLIPETESLKDTDYIIFYLDEPIESYQNANAKYLADKLFNTNLYNVTVAETVYGTRTVHGTSDFFNGFPTKKPFLAHQTATFDISGRISAGEARALYEFQDILGRGILPRPLPIFIDREELEQDSIALFKKGADEGERIGYREIIETLLENPLHRDNLGNYYLLFYLGGEIKDFDFVSKFEYALLDEFGKHWQVQDLFGVSYQPTIRNVFEFQYSVLVPIFNNALVVKTKSGGFQHRYFDELEAKYCKSDNTYLLVMKYRKAFYDFIYKSKRQAVTKPMFDDILLTGVLDDIRLDELKNGVHTQNYSIRQKLNIWFSLSDNFKIKNKTSQTMANKLQAHRQFIQELAKGQTSIQTDEQYAFTVGQVVYYLLRKSNTSDTSYQRLEPFLQQVHVRELNKAVARLFDTYKHETFSSNFRNPFAEVMAYETKASIRDLMPIMLAGVFSTNALFSDKEQKSKEDTDSTE